MGLTSQQSSLFASATKNIYQALSKLKLYSLNQGSNIDAELSAYNVGFLLLEKRLQQLEAKAFVQTATGKELAQYEALVGLQEGFGKSEEERRTQVIYRLSVAPYDFTTQRIHRSVQAAGVTAKIKEQPFLDRLVLEVLSYLDSQTNLDQVKFRLLSMLPAHIEFDFEYGTFSWDLFELSQATWDLWDTKNFTWNEFDTNGEAIFT